jgi:hypothetical protein
VSDHSEWERHQTNAYVHGENADVLPTDSLTTACLYLICYVHIFLNTFYNELTMRKLGCIQFFTVDKRETSL